MSSGDFLFVWKKAGWQAGTLAASREHAIYCQCPKIGNFFWVQLWYSKDAGLWCVESAGPSIGTGRFLWMLIFRERFLLLRRLGLRGIVGIREETSPYRYVSWWYRLRWRRTYQIRKIFEFVLIVSRRAPIYLPESQKLHYALSGAGLRDANLQNTDLHNVRLIDTGPHIKSVTKWKK